ncbi:uncharacterized protein LOC105775544 [Gossypium raimondii]|uniref:uncharacterized protein LOC105775544 n=1 Tax=Gossypium raimondii TaxID=29730 RepID=UPI00063AD563|nr:uncharacterized protein LOC105775544 [Gossypium raimondii]
MSSLCENSNFEKSISEELTPKKVRFRGGDVDTNNIMMIDSSPEKPISWKDMLVGQSSKETFNDLEGKDDLDILEGDIQKSFVNGVPSISFSDRIHKILIQGMDNTVILKLLGRNIGFSVLQNKLYNLWKPSTALHMMDIENGYFLVKFQNKLDCEKTLSEGPWIIFGQYLTVQPWSLAFDPTQAYPNVVMAWIRFPGLPGYLYNHKIITEIGEMVGKVVKLDMNTDNRTRGRFARLAVYVDLEKPLNTNKVGAEKENGNFGPWLIVEKKSRRKIRENVNNSFNSLQSGKEGSRFRVLNDKDSHKEDDEGFLLDPRRDKEWRKNGKNNSKEVDLKEIGGPNSKVNDRPILEPNKSNSILKENSRNIDKSVSSLGNGDLTAGQIQGALGSSALELEAQQLSTTDGRGSRSFAAAEMQTIPGDGVGFRPEGESSKNRIVLKDSARDSIVVSLDVGNLDSGRHSAVVFHKSFQSKENNNVHSPKNFDSSLVLSSGSGSQRTSLKESMEYLTESISTFASPNLGFPDKSKRKLLWDDLKSAISNLSSPWLIMGDFNAILSSSDKKSPVSIGKRCDLFGNFVESCELQDLGFNGPTLTWQRGGTFVRLDRALANDAWVSAFPQYSVLHLIRIKSDHRPLLLSTASDLNISQSRPFRFLAGRAKHSDFSNLVKEKWNFAGNMFESLNNFTFFAKDWNRNIYGFLGTRTRNLMRSLNNIQKTMKHPSSTYLAGKELEIRDELENVLDHEDLLWRQKARCDWLQLGDRNTKFFHSRTMRRRKFNRITTLRVDNGDWCTDQYILQAKAVEFFEGLFREDSSTLRDIPNVGFPRFNSSEITFLEAHISNEEIKRALFDMAPLKAPGSDGFHAHFFQSQWDVLGNDVCQ